LIYLSLFIFCLSLGTFFPFASETYLSTLFLSEKYNNFILLIFASLGNILGSLISWIFGYFINYFMNKSTILFLPVEAAISLRANNPEAPR